MINYFRILYWSCFVYMQLVNIALASKQNNMIISKDFPFPGFAQEIEKDVVYRLIGNDMPPLQTLGQLRWNTKYALQNEALHHGVHKRWILNRIWNETEYELIYKELVGMGVNRRDILSRCFDIKTYSSIESIDDRLYYLTSQNEGRNEGILEGREDGFEWTIILDGNTFLTKDSLDAIQSALKSAKKNQLYMKIPYHRVHSLQDESWLNAETTMKDVLKFAPTKGESQVAFHRNANELFSLGDTKPDAKDPSKRKGYGARNKSYMFKEGQICGPESKQCICGSVFEGNEEDLKNATLSKSYTKDCGLVLRLWSYPTENVVHTGLSAQEEKGLFCFYESIRDSLHKQGTECKRLTAGIKSWQELKSSERKKYATSDTGECKKRYQAIVLTDSCFRAVDREIAQANTNAAIMNMAAGRLKLNSPDTSLCSRIRPPKDDPSRVHYLTVFDPQTLAYEKSAWRDPKSNLHNEMSPLLADLFAKADHGLSLGPYSVTFKKRLPHAEVDRRNYFSARHTLALIWGQVYLGFRQHEI